MALRSILDALPAAVLHTDEQYSILLCNQAACAWFGYTFDEMLGRNVASLLTTVPGSTDHDSAAVLWLSRCGEMIAASVSRRPVADGGGILWVFTDGAEELAVRRETSRRLIESREEERLRLARDVHDGAIQELIGINFGLADLSRKLGGAELKLIEQQQSNVQGVVRLLRGLVSELRPAGLEEFGLAAAIEGLAAKTARACLGRTQLQLELEEVPELSRSRQLCLFRGAQEALQNCLRHAQASRILVRLQRRGARVELSVEDDGVGFDVPARLGILTRANHYGLAGIAERAELVTGSLVVVSRPGSGTTVRLAVVVSPKEAT